MMQILEKIFSFIDLLSYAYPILSPIIFLLIVLFNRDRLSVKLDGVAKFLSSLVLVSLIKICFWNGRMVETNPYDIGMSNFLLVFLEDVFYVMVPFYLTNRISNKKINFAIWLSFSLMFGVGHRYQGMFAILVTAIYPYFISNYYARRTSFGTVMACHFLWDCFVMLLPKVNNLLVLMDKVK
jgi:hypothetical protein